VADFLINSSVVCFSENCISTFWLLVHITILHSWIVLRKQRFFWVVFRSVNNNSAAFSQLSVCWLKRACPGCFLVTDKYKIRYFDGLAREVKGDFLRPWTGKMPVQPLPKPPAPAPPKKPTDVASKPVSTGHNLRRSSSEGKPAANEQIVTRRRSLNTEQKTSNRRTSEPDRNTGLFQLIDQWRKPVFCEIDVGWSYSLAIIGCLARVVNQCTRTWLFGCFHWECVQKVAFLYFLETKRETRRSVLGAPGKLLGWGCEACFALWRTERVFGNIGFLDVTDPTSAKRIDYKKGDTVLCRWSDRRMYPATILKQTDPGN